MTTKVICGLNISFHGCYYALKLIGVFNLDVVVLTIVPVLQCRLTKDAFKDGCRVFRSRIDYNFKVLEILTRLFGTISVLILLGIYVDLAVSTAHV